MKDVIYEFLDYILLERKYSDFTETSYELDLFKYEEYLNNHKINYLKVNYNNISDFNLLCDTGKGNDKDLLFPYSFSKKILKSDLAFSNSFSVEY